LGPNIDEHLVDVKCILDGRKRKGWSALLPDQSPVGFAEIVYATMQMDAARNRFPF
jgi:hypothetical protein